VAPTTARFYKYTFPPAEEKNGPETVIVKMDSENTNCMTISVQYPSVKAFQNVFVFQINFILSLYI
jgi:hypothetical protein